MQTSFDRTALIFLGVFTILLVSPASAEWNIDVLDQPDSFQNISNASETVQVIELTDGGGTPINESQLAGDSYVQYRYNGSVRDMVWLNNGYWYADFKLNETGGEIEFEAEGETQSSLIGDSTSETNATRSFNLGNMSVDLINDFSEPINPENSFDIKVNVTDSVNEMFEDEADVDFYFTNGTWKSEIYNINNVDDLDGDGTDDHYKNFGLEFGLDYYSTYILHINATNTTNTNYENPYGVQSIAVETLPRIEGEIQRLNASSGCDTQSFFTECERGTDIGTAFNITNSEAENVNLTLSLRNSTSENWENQTTVVLEGDGDYFTGEITVPDINTSRYDRVFRLRYNATNGGREAIVDRTFDYNDFRIVDKSDSVTAKGSYPVRLEIRNYFTPQLLEESRIEDSEISIDQPSGDTLTTFTVEDMERRENSGHFRTDVDIPVDAETGIYDMNVQVTNLYDNTKSEVFNFNVTEIQQTFILNDGEKEFEETVNKTGEHSFNITVENRLTSETNITTEISEELDNFTEVNGGENITLDSDETRSINLTFDIESVDDYEGEIKFIDENTVYNATIDVELSSNPCSHRSNSICVLGSGLNASSDERGEIVKDFTAINFGEKNESYSYTFDVSGNITDYASLGADETTLNTENDSEVVNLTYDVSVPGFYSGSLEIGNGEETVEIPISLESDVEPTSVNMDVSDEIELGEVEEGDSASSTIEIENTGDTEITSIEISSEDYTVSADSVSVSPGSTETVSIEFSEIDSESGELTVTAEGNTDTATETVSISATVVPDYGEQADELEQRVIDLDSQVSSDSDQQTQLNQVQSSISDLRSAYRQGDYERAQTLSTQIQNTLDTVEMEVSSSSEPEPSNPSRPNQTEEGGGIPILPIAAVIFVILVVGFIGYTSVEFEKGDPLYNVLGQ